jgi:predicted amidophosphoribosyltransferase
MSNNKVFDVNRLAREINPVPLEGPFDKGLALSRFSIDDFHRRSYLGEVVRRMKNSEADGTAGLLSRVIVEALRCQPLAHPPDIVIPIPDTVPGRAFSLPLRLAEHLAAHFDCGVGEDILSLHGVVVPQKNRPLEERRNDTQSRYTLRPDITLAGKSILLFDDIYASGQSMNEAAEIIRHSQPLYLTAVVLVSFI